MLIHKNSYFYWRLAMAHRSFSFLGLAMFVLIVNAQVTLNETTPCQIDISNMTGSLPTYPSTLLMQDASGKGSFGVYIAFQNLIDPGHWDECERLGDDIAHYCFLRSEFGIPGTTSELPTVTGICVPSSCSAEDIEGIPYPELINALDAPSLGKILDTQREISVHCREKAVTSTGTKVFYGIVAILMIMTLLGTIVDIIIGSRFVEAVISHEKYDESNAVLSEEPTFEDTDIASNYTYFTEDENAGLLEATKSRKIPSTKQDTLFMRSVRSTPSDLEEIVSSSTFSPSKLQIATCCIAQCLLCWSAIRNFKFLFYANTAPAHERFKFMHGIKVLASLWTVLGYTIFYVSMFGWINVERLSETESTLFYQLYYNSATYAADIFWTFSGILVTYHSIRIMKQRSIRTERVLDEYNSFLNVPIYIFRRFVRFWPPLFLAVFFFWYGSYVWANGPFWPWYLDYVNGQCTEYWWSPTFFVTSLYPKFSFNQLDPLDGCFSWAWYISVQLLCFLWTPILIFLYYKRKIVGMSATGVLIIFSISSGIIICAVENLSIGIGPQTESEHGDYFNLYYSKPYTRGHSYFFGVLVAFMIQMKPYFRVPLFARLVVYAIVWPVLFILFFLTYNIWNHGGWSDVENVMFASLQHPIFSICFATSMYLMSLGYKGPLNLRSFFSHPYWLPLSRLSYGIYLYAPIVVLMASFSTQTSLAYTSKYVVFQFFVFSIISYVGSLIQFLILEKPFLNSTDFAIDLFSVLLRRIRTKPRT